MKMKFNKKVLILVLIIAIFLPTITHAVSEDKSNTQDSTDFFYIDKEEAAPGEVVTMNIDLSKIEYEDFEFSLISDKNLSNITTSDDIDTDLSNNEFLIKSNKSEINLEKISLYYKIPEDSIIGSTINLTGTISNKNSLAESEESEYKKVSLTIKVVEEADNNKNQTEENNNEANSSTVNNSVLQNVNNLESDKKDQTLTTNKAVSNNSIFSLASSVSKSNEQTENATYNGESNNYLTALSVSGYEITPSFCKTSNTYFITVSENTTSITVTAETEDESAKISISGNTSLKSGENKVLISVTAENGNVRMYRIYVKK